MMMKKVMGPNRFTPVCLKRTKRAVSTWSHDSEVFIQWVLLALLCGNVQSDVCRDHRECVYDLSTWRGRKERQR